MEGDSRNPRVSLLRKYDIPIDHITYEYVEKSTNKRELERIIRILRSGEEGSYPDLLKFTEERLRLFAPDSRVLRVETPILTKESLTNEEWSAVEEELLSWEKEMKIMDSSLDFEKNRVNTVGNKNMPAIRKAPQILSATSRPISKITKQQTNTKPEKIKSGDYAAWDKYDVEKELLKLDVEEEKKQEETKKKKIELKKQTKEKILDLGVIDKESYSAMEQLVLANQAKDRGNECYKSGDLENALKYYDISINLYSTPNAYNNRAMAYLKLKNYQKAIENCNKVLDLEKNNIKALHRRATAYQNLSDSRINNNNNDDYNNNDINIKESRNNNYDELALQDLYKIVFLEPNNKSAQSDLQKLKQKLNIEEVGKKFRMPITESEDNNSDKTNFKKIGDVTKSVWNSKDNFSSLDKLPLTYYGPSTSTFQCEPYSMVHRALSGSSIPGQILCKCNSNRPRQNPLCQRCGEAMCTPKPSSKTVQNNTKSVSKLELEYQNKNKPQTSLSIKKEKKEKISENLNNYSENSEVDKESVAEKINSESKLENVTFVEKEEPISNKLKLVKNDESEIQAVEKIVENFKSNNTLNHTADISNKSDVNNSSPIIKKINEEGEKTKLSKIVDINKDSVKPFSKSEGKEKNYLTENNQIYGNSNRSEIKNIEISSSLKKANHKGKKSRNKKGKSKEHKEIDLRNCLERVKIVHAAKYLHPTSVEPKIKVENCKESNNEINSPNSCQFKDFVPNKMYSSGTTNKVESLDGAGKVSSANKCLKYISSDKLVKEKMSNLFSEGNKENLLQNKTPENLDREIENKEVKKEVIESAFEFIKTWEELKKVDDNYVKRAEIIRTINPNNLGKVIGMKLDSDMLRCFLECLDRHFLKNDPKIVVEFLRQLPQIPRFELISMFLAESDKRIIKKLINFAEDQGFQLDDNIKKVLSLNS